MDINYMGRVLSFIRAIENESSIDSFAYSQFGFLQKDFLYFPRPAKWIMRMPSILIKFSPFRFAFSYLLLFPLFLLCSVTPFLYCFRSFLNGRLYFECCGSLCLVNGKRSFTVLSELDDRFPNAVKVYLKNDNMYSGFIFDGCRYIGVFGKLKVLSYLILSFLYILLTRRFSLIFQFYTAYQFFAIQEMIIDSKPKRLITSQHYDRWAILANDIINFSPEVNDVVIVQHGVESTDFFCYASNNGLTVNRLCNVSKLFVYNDFQLNIFLGWIVDDCVKFSTDFEFFAPPGLNLTNVSLKNGFSAVLFIGHPLYETLHLKLYKKLTECFKVQCYYKPHPTAKMSSSLAAEGWLIVDSDIYPNVDFVVSYESTLAYQYIDKGVVCFMHKDIVCEADYEETQLSMINSCEGLLPALS